MRLGVIVLLLALNCPCVAFAQNAATDHTGPMVAFVRMVSSVPNNSIWAKLIDRHGLGIFRDKDDCWPRMNGETTLYWTGRTGEVDIKPYSRTFAEALKEGGFASAGNPDNLFGQGDQRSDLLVAANVKSISSTLCLSVAYPTVQRSPHELDNNGEVFRDLDSATGTMTVTVDWQLYSTSLDKTLDDQLINGSVKIERHERGNYDRFFQLSIEDSIKSYLRTESFKSAVRKAVAPDGYRSGKLELLHLPGSASAKARKISDAVGSVVLVLSGGGHGSGFLVSSDGHLMTAAHVVGSDKYVKIRWSDGLEGVGEVVRTYKPRDVALIKTDPRGRQPLALRRDPPQPGDTVFAIGAPIDPKLQNTVTRGVVSANRIMDGFSFIQSDVTVDPGNSGGPLLDEQGRVLGFTDKGLRTPEAPTGLNFFVPIDDALRFLSAEPQ